jgi:hypothetical protein|nr:MAG TPA: virion assembly protein [Caudoviricetes sp.]
MGFSIKKAFKKVVKVATLGAYHGGYGGSGGAVEAPTPAPELDLIKQEGEAEQKEETTKVKYRRGKKALKITKKDTPATGAGRNIV